MKNFLAKDFFDTKKIPQFEKFNQNDAIWTFLNTIKNFITKNSIEGSVHKNAIISGENIYIAKSAIVEAGAIIKGPAWIDENTVIRAGAYIRENVLVGKGAVLGNSCEFKNCIIGDQCEVPHFNYVGDSILGFKAHLGAGVILSNVRLDRKNIHLKINGENIDSGRRKFGAIIGDYTEIGCNSVINPGSIIGKNCILYPNSTWSGILKKNHIVKAIQKQEILAKSK